MCPSSLWTLLKEVSHNIYPSQQEITAQAAGLKTKLDDGHSRSVFTFMYQYKALQ